MQRKFLVIGASPQDEWYQMLQRALKPVGEVTLSDEKVLEPVLSQHIFEIIIVDAGVVEDATALVARLMPQQPGARIIVVTSSPTWQRARDAFKSGATDYIRKSTDLTDLLSYLKPISEK